MDLRILLVVTLLALKAECTYNILCIFPVPYSEQHVISKSFIKTLLKLKYNVVLATPYPEFKKENNYPTMEVIDMSELRVYEKDVIKAYTREADTHSYMMSIGEKISSMTVKNEELSNLILDNDRRFDLVIIEWLFTEILAGYAAVLKVPCIMYSTELLYHYSDARVSHNSILLHLNTKGMCECFPNFIINGLMYSGTLINMYCAEYYQAFMQYIRYYTTFTSLSYLRNGHFISYNEPTIYIVNTFPLVAPVAKESNVIDIPGLHILYPYRPVSRAYETHGVYFEGGVIFVDLGPTHNLSHKVKKELLDVFEQQPFNVVWRTDEKIDVKPRERVYLLYSYILRQNVLQILSHNITRIMITLGDTPNTIEAVFHGIPMIVAPVLASHRRNAVNAVKLGYAIEVTYGENLASELSVALKHMVHDRTYRERAKELSENYSKLIPNADRDDALEITKRYFNFLVSPVDVVSYYIKFIIKSKGADGFRPNIIYGTFPLIYMIIIVMFSSMCGMLCSKIIQLKEIRKKANKEWKYLSDEMLKYEQHQREEQTQRDQEYEHERRQIELAREQEKLEINLEKERRSQKAGLPHRPCPDSFPAGYDNNNIPHLRVWR